MNNPTSPTQTFSGNPVAEDHTEARLIQHRLLLLKCYGAIQSGDEEELESVVVDIATVLGI